MSLSADRTALATALDAVTDISAYTDWPPQMVPGDLAVHWGGYDAQGPPLMFASTWKLQLIAGGTPGDAMVFVDNHLSAILDAIDQLVFITGVRPVEFQTPNGVLYGAEITAQKES